jgi:hypothetical protein
VESADQAVLVDLLALGADLAVPDSPKMKAVCAVGVDRADPLLPVGLAQGSAQASADRRAAVDSGAAHKQAHAM